ncbi:MAG: SelB C-terminal domain-containing protein [Humibacillus sp.]|nr:SelB C-terminal domain-containing protein [Humibacillus sp.]MDN5777714.1 SelB C-terminal domain-containing protein [Humibacillus sp.]
MAVIATAGHVDHGKSALVRALTGIEPDRWQEERRRGMTIDLGYAWTTLPSGVEVAFVDVPGHERFIGNMIAGLGPAPAVLFVVAADEGWRQQSEEHLTAVEALGLQQGLLVVTRSDLADPDAALRAAGERLRVAGLGGWEAVSVSARTGQGLPALRAALDRLVAALPEPDTDAPARLWVDRSFTVRGSGTVVTGTLGQGRIGVGDRLRLITSDEAEQLVTVRGLESMERATGQVSAVCRVALNLRGVGADEVGRGDLLVTTDAGHATTVVDVALTTVGGGEDDGQERQGDRHGGGQGAGRREHSGEDRGVEALPSRVMAHIGTLAIEARVRPLASAGLPGGTARLTFGRAMPLRPGDRLILRDAGARRVLAGARVLDTDPPLLARRGAAAQRAADLAALSGGPDLAHDVGRRGAMTVTDAVALGHRLETMPVEGTSAAPDVNDEASGAVRRGRWLVDGVRWREWGHALRAAVERQAYADPLQPTLPLEAARAAAEVPDRALLAMLAAELGLEVVEGRVGLPGVRASLDPSTEAALRVIEQRLQAEPCNAPEQHDLDAAGLGPRQLAAAEKAGRILRLPGDVVLLPTSPARAMRVLAALPQPFTTSEARQALGSTRRTMIPLLEHLDARGWTRRLDGTRREVRR